MLFTCQDTVQLIPLLFDDELHPEEAEHVEAHLQVCASCAEAAQREGALRLALRKAAREVVAPAALRERLRASYGTSSMGVQSMLWRKWPLAAAAMVLVAITWQGSQRFKHHEWEELTQRHTHDVPMDVVHPNHAVVQQYLRGRLPFAVRVLPASVVSAQALSGRVVPYKNKEAAYVRYDTPQGRLSLMVHEAGLGEDDSEIAPLYQWGSKRVRVEHVHGYPVARWEEAGLVYTLIGDVPEQDMLGFFGKVLR